MRKRSTSSKHLFVVMNQISQESTFILMQSCEQKSLKLSNGGVYHISKAITAP